MAEFGYLELVGASKKLICMVVRLLMLLRTREAIALKVSKFVGYFWRCQHLKFGVVVLLQELT